MAGDIAKIGIEADTRDLKEAKTDLDNLSPAADKAEKSVKKFTDRIKDLGNAMSGKITSAFGIFKSAIGGFVGGLVASLGVDRLIGALADLSDKLDNISKAASRLGESMGNIQGLAAAADLAGIEMGQMTNILQRMNKTLADAVAKGKGTQGIFKALGLSAQDLLKMPINERIATLADRIQELNPSAEQLALILAKLGDRSGVLTALVQNGGDDIRDATAMIKEFGGELTTLDGKNIEAMNDAFTKLGYAFQAIGNQILAGVSPSIAIIVEGLAYLVSGFNLVITVIGFFARVLYNGFVQPFITAAKLIDQAFQAVFGIDIISAAKTGVNFVINVFKGAFAAVQVIWDRLPVVFQAAALGGAKMALDAINKFVQGSIKSFNYLAESIGSIFGAKIGDTIDPEKFSVANTDIYKTIKAQMTGANSDLKNMWKDVKGAFSAQMSVDNFANANDKSATAVTKNKLAIDALNDALGTNGEKADKASEKLTILQGISKELDRVAAPFDQAQSAFQKLSDMQKNGILTGDQYVAVLERIHDAFIMAGGTAEQWAKIITKSTNDIATALNGVLENALTGTGDAFADLLMTGKADFKALADSIIRDILRMAWQAAVVKPLLNFLSPIIGTVTGSVGTSTASTSVASAAAQPTSFSTNMMQAANQNAAPTKRVPSGSLAMAANGGGGNKSLSIGKVEMHMHSDGNQTPDDDRRQGERVANAFTERMRGIAVETFMDMTSYGGSANPKGVRK